MGRGLDPRLTREFLEQCVSNRMTDGAIGRLFGVAKHVVAHARKVLGVASFRKGRKRLYDVGYHGEVKALERFQRGKLWFFRCLCRCGKEFEARVTHIGSLKTTSCGCVRNANSRRNLWKGYADISGCYWGDIRRRNEKWGTDSITIEDAWELFLLQDRRCALSGVALCFQPEQTASLDRIDSLKGYVQGNVQWVHKMVNKIKNNLPQDEFILWCKLVTERSASGE